MTAVVLCELSSPQNANFRVRGDPSPSTPQSAVILSRRRRICICICNFRIAGHTPRMPFSGHGGPDRGRRRSTASTVFMARELKQKPCSFRKCQTVCGRSVLAWTPANCDVILTTLDSFENPFGTVSPCARHLWRHVPEIGSLQPLKELQHLRLRHWQWITCRQDVARFAGAVHDDHSSAVRRYGQRYAHRARESSQIGEPVDCRVCSHLRGQRLLAESVQIAGEPINSKRSRTARECTWRKVVKIQRCIVGLNFPQANLCNFACRRRVRN